MWIFSALMFIFCFLNDNLHDCFAVILSKPIWWQKRLRSIHLHAARIVCSLPEDVKHGNSPILCGFRMMLCVSALCFSREQTRLCCSLKIAVLRAKTACFGLWNRLFGTPTLTILPRHFDYFAQQDSQSWCPGCTKWGGERAKTALRNVKSTISVCQYFSEKSAFWKRKTAWQNDSRKRCTAVILSSRRG